MSSSCAFLPYVCMSLSLSLSNLIYRISLYVWDRKRRALLSNREHNRQVYSWSVFFRESYMTGLTQLCLTSHKRDIGKRCRPRSDAAERDVWSGSVHCLHWRKTLTNTYMYFKTRVTESWKFWNKLHENRPKFKEVKEVLKFWSSESRTRLWINNVITSQLKI